MLTPEKLHQEIKANTDVSLEIIRKNPWLIPASIALTTAPLTISVYGFWKNRQLSKQLKIEREKTKQIALNKAPAKNHRPFKLH